MKKIVTHSFLVAGAALMLVGFGGTTTQAAQITTYQHKSSKVKWHKGTPKNVRGKFKTKHYGADLMMETKIRAKSTWFWGSGMPIQKGYNVHYKKTGHNHYVIRYDAHASGMFKGGKKLTMSVNKVGKNIKVFGYSNVFYKY
ncbi:hypothetical protein [Levilactobacillus parabrevis]|uniref:hypothetical protein n=1 Tax=Levilactobacillus parabrevis TaxID=357278 RepID=UPI0021A950C3|nr:hypothetical protein [Levilactobacillus parabrevis]MCT4488407.1 hypothetical protein [Levilactobacillus parabrevis]MCT4490752.1 hypothetical protein [Levilactobacillus parabrevis]